VNYSLYFWDDTSIALNVLEEERISQEYAIRILVQELDNLLLYMEPSKSGLESYSYKSRELLILSCTELENQWRAILSKSNVQPKNKRDYTTNDYVDLITKTHLHEFSVKLKNITYKAELKPFANWNPTNPTQSLVWYDSYNKTKHDRN
jgi:hypothetical protein